MTPFFLQHTPERHGRRYVQLTETMSSPSEYDIRPLHQDDYDRVLYLLTHSFFVDEPILRGLQVTNTFDFSNDVINGCLKDQCSFVAYDKQSKEIAGICLNERERRGQVIDAPKYDEKINFVIELLDHLQDETTIFDRLNVDTVLHIYIINVDQSARGHGLASRLISKSIEHAKNINLGGAFAEATNVYSLNCFKQQHFDILYELKYTDCNPERLASMTDPHYDRCYLVGRQLQPR